MTYNNKDIFRMAKNLTEKKATELEVTDVRYYETRRGQGYECKTNKMGITIWNDGMGGQTYIEILSHLSSTEEERKKFRELGDDDLEKLIDEYEYKKQRDGNL